VTLDIGQHFEVMDHEVSGLDYELSVEGYRVDGDNGIRKVVGVNKGKVIDYFMLKRSRCIFVEFSDLVQGKVDILKREKEINDWDDGVDKNIFKKLIKNAARDEMASKFKDSRNIFAKIPNKYVQYPSEFAEQGAKTFFIIHAPICEQLPDSDKVAITKYLRLLEDRVSACLEDEICDRVKLMLLDVFEREYAAP